MMKAISFLGRPRHDKVSVHMQIISLFDRIRAVQDPKVSISSLLNQWIEEGHTVSRPQLQSLVRAMKDFKRYHHALQVTHSFHSPSFLPLYLVSEKIQEKGMPLNLF